MSHVIRYVRVLGNAISATTLQTDCILLERERERRGEVREGREEVGKRKRKRKSSFDCALRVILFD